MLITNKPLIVLNFFSRPHNFAKVIHAWKNQSIECPIIVVDNRNDKEETVSKIGWRLQDVWRWTVNSGCPCHFYPALDYPQYKYTLFADDDLLPGPRAVETLLKCAKSIDDKFATIGQQGRKFNLDNAPGYRYSGRSSFHRKSGEMVKTHLTVRSHLILTENLPHVLSFRNQLARMGESEFRMSRIHDDFLMCIPLQMRGLPSYLTPLTIDTRYPKQYELIMEDVDDKSALWKNNQHFEDRNRLVDIALDMGWKPLID